MPGAGRLRRFLFPPIPGDGAAHDQGAGRHLRLGRRLEGPARGVGNAGEGRHQGEAGAPSGGLSRHAPCTAFPGVVRGRRARGDCDDNSEQGWTGAAVGPGRLERLLRPLHQRRAQRHRADDAVPLRCAIARRYGLWPHPAGARHRLADRQSLLRLPRLSPGAERGAQRRHGDALRPERAAYVHRRLRRHAADLGWSDYMKGAEVVQALGQFGLHLPRPSLEVLSALGSVAPLLVTAVPLGIYNFTEGMNNVESAAAAGDNYNLRHILVADGIGAVVGSLLGSPFPPAVYIGHPGWTAVAGRIGYSLATGLVIGVVCFLGLTALLIKIVPLVAILPILLYIGLVIGAQAFTRSPPRHAAAVMLAIVPNIAAWTQNQVDGALGAAGTNAAAVAAHLG